MLTKFSNLFAMMLGLAVCVTVPLLAQRRGAEPSLPDGNGKQIVQTVCAGCHTLDYITRGWGYDKKGWDELIATMIALPPDTENQISTYLSQHFSCQDASCNRHRSRPGES